MLKEFREERKIFERQQRIAERTMLPVFRKALKQTIKPVIDFVNQMGTDMNPSSLIDTNVWQSAYTSLYNELGIKIARQEYFRQRGFETQKASNIGFLVDVWQSLFRDYALNYVYQISRELNQTTIDIITAALGEVNALGLDRDGSIRLFEKTLNGKMRLRSLTISRTESTTLSNLGKEVGARAWIDESGQKSYKVWLGRNDGRERAAHLDENNTILPIEGQYNLDGELCDRPGAINLSAGQRINCRCTQSIMSETRYNGYVRRGRIVNGKLIGAS